ncbi:MAG: YgaP family membrane protein [Halapricum sp.]
MDQNVGSADRLVRIVAGIALLTVAIALFAGIGGVSATVGTVVGPLALALIGAVLVVTGYLQTCPAYQVIGFRTLGR